MRKKLYLIGYLVGVGILLFWLHWWMPTTPNLPKPPLKDLAAARQIQIGNYASLRRLNDKVFTDILTSQYAFVTDDGELNWTFNDGTLRPSIDRFDFSNSDKVVAFAEAHHLPVEAHHLVWGEDKWLPTWLKDGNFNKDQLLEILHNHISQVAGHYKGRIQQWTVVNEAFTRGDHINNLHDWWGDHVGDKSYIDQSFIWARQADPNAKLLLNDFHIEGINPLSTEVYQYVKGMKARGVPIDGIGLQMHIDATNAPSKESVIANMQRFADLGVGVYVTEFDVDLNQVPGTEDSRFARQAVIYKDMLSACVESKVCHSFAELGITDKETWYNELGWTSSKPLPFDDKYRPKPAFYAMREALSQ